MFAFKFQLIEWWKGNVCLKCKAIIVQEIVPYSVFARELKHDGKV